MKDKKHQEKPLEIKATWAVDDDWKTHRDRPADKDDGWALRMFNNISAKFDASIVRCEEERVSWSAWLKRLPKCALRSIPLVISLAIAYWLIAAVVAWMSGVEEPIMTIFVHWPDVIYMTMVFALLVGSREARYREGVFKPSLRHLLDYIKSSWFWLLITFGFMSFIGLHDGTGTEPYALQLFTICVLVLAIFWTSDLTAYKSEKADNIK